MSFLLSGGASVGVSVSFFFREAMSDILAHAQFCRKPLAETFRVAILTGMPKQRGNVKLVQPALGELAGHWMKLGLRERLVLVHVAERLLMGQKAYGPLTKGKKNWRKEAAEEHLDATVYMAAELIDALEE